MHLVLQAKPSGLKSDEIEKRLVETVGFEFLTYSNSIDCISDIWNCRRSWITYLAFNSTENFSNCSYCFQYNWRYSFEISRYNSDFSNILYRSCDDSTGIFLSMKREILVCLLNIRFCLDIEWDRKIYMPLSMLKNEIEMQSIAMLWSFISNNWSNIRKTEITWSSAFSSS